MGRGAQVHAIRPRKSGAHVQQQATVKRSTVHQQAKEKTSTQVHQQAMVKRRGAPAHRLADEQ
jgi:hypothetical protein